MHCTFCSTPLVSGARYCHNCGAGVALTTSGASRPYLHTKAPAYADVHDVPRGYSTVPRTSTTAILALLCGIAAWSVAPVLGAIGAVITGRIARREIQEARGAIEGDGMATFGLALGYLQLGLIALVLCIVLVALIIVAIAHS